MTRIEPSIPQDWAELEQAVGRILRECGLHVELNKRIQLARGHVDIDVHAHDFATSPGVTSAFECKHWGRRVSKNVVHSFRSWVSDSGYNAGFLVSPSGFQRGSYDAAAYSNVRLLDWHEFQSVYAGRWYRDFMVPTLQGEAGVLIESSAAPGLRFLGGLFFLSRRSQDLAMALRDKYSPIGTAVKGLIDGKVPTNGNGVPCLPLRDSYREIDAPGVIPEDMLDAPALRPLMDSAIAHLRKGNSEFAEIEDGWAWK